jgi:hypothetical protein
LFRCAGKQIQNALALFAQAEHKKQIFEMLSRCALALTVD